MERRGQQILDRVGSPPTRGPRVRTRAKKEETPDRWTRIGLLAQDKNVVFNNLFCFFTEENLRQAFRSLDGSKAVGIDNVSKDDYGRNLDQNIKALLDRLYGNQFKPMPKREVLIPKANGKMRPIAIGPVEDKMVEALIARVLNLIYEPLFINNSFGFRPRRSTDQAIKANYNILKDNKRPYVVEIDLANFFNTVSHQKLLKILKMRISDNRLLGLINRFLMVDILKASGNVEATEVGTPQGSVVSPILANIFLNEALDQWFYNNHATDGATMVRYADDAVFMFSQEDQAKDFLIALKERLQTYCLSLNEDKTRIINFRKGKGTIFSFLGFTFFWNTHKRGQNKIGLYVKTQKEKLLKKIKEYEDWIKLNRAKHTTKEIWKIVRAKLLGHYAYFGYYCNRSKLSHYYSAIINATYKWLNRRSQRKSFNWERFKRRLVSENIPTPPEPTTMKQLGWSPYVK